MKVADLVQHKRRGHLALVLEINDLNKSADIVWVGTSPVGTPPFDNFSIRRLRVISEGGNITKLKKADVFKTSGGN